MKAPRALPLAAALLLLLAAAQPAAQEGPHTIPRAVFVGDRATLIVPLPGFQERGGAEAGDTEVPADRLPSSPYADIHRVAIERRPGGARLAVEFAAFSPGIIELPPIEVAGQVFSGLRVEIGSVLGASEPPVLSPPAMPLAVPGTALLVYGTAGAVALALLAASLASLRGRAALRAWLAAWRRRRLLGAMLRAERRMRKALAKGAAPREVLDALSGEFRGFLEGLTGESCRAMTAAEMAGLGIPECADGASGASAGEFLGGFFGRCDGMRFGGRAAGEGEALEMLDGLRGFLDGLGRAPARAGNSA